MCIVVAKEKSIGYVFLGLFTKLDAPRSQFGKSGSRLEKCPATASLIFNTPNRFCLTFCSYVINYGDVTSTTNSCESVKNVRCTDV